VRAKPTAAERIWKVFMVSKSLRKFPRGKMILLENGVPSEARVPRGSRQEMITNDGSEGCSKMREGTEENGRDAL
jgi:hypothetical protein